MPVEGFDFGLAFEVEQSEIEHRLGLFFDLLDIMEGFHAILLGEIALNFKGFGDLFGVRILAFDLDGGFIFFERAEGFDDENGMVGDDGAAAFADDDGVGDLFGVADVHDIVDDIASVLLEGVIGGGIEGGAGAIVIDAEATADIDVAEFVAHFEHFGVETRGLADGAFDGADVGDLGADVEVDEFEGMSEAFLFEEFACVDEFGGIDAELGIFATAGRPFAGAFGGEADADADHGFDADFFRDAKDFGEFLDFFDDEDDFFTEFEAEEGGLDEDLVFVAVADDQAIGVAMDG